MQLLNSLKHVLRKMQKIMRQEETGLVKRLSLGVTEKNKRNVFFINKLQRILAQKPNTLTEKVDFLWLCKPSNSLQKQIQTTTRTDLSCQRIKNNPVMQCWSSAPFFTVALNYIQTIKATYERHLCNGHSTQLYKRIF